MKNQSFFKVAKAVFFLLFCCVLLSCGVIYGVVEFDKKLFEQKWAEWEKQGIVNYSVVQSYSSSYLPESKARITVTSNEIANKEALSDWDIVQLEKNPDYLPEIFTSVKTISEIFEWVKECYENFKKRDDRQVRIRITYNDEFHYPESIRISFEYLPKGRPPIGSATLERDLSEFVPHY